VERVEGVSARRGALFHERFLRREQGRVKLALRRGERAVCGKRPCCIYGMEIGLFNGCEMLSFVRAFAHRCQRRSRWEIESRDETRD
jgi:hypothetical protein